MKNTTHRAAELMFDWLKDRSISAQPPKWQADALISAMTAEEIAEWMPAATSLAHDIAADPWMNLHNAPAQARMVLEREIAFWLSNTAQQENADLPDTASDNALIALVFGSQIARLAYLHEILGVGLQT